MGTDASRERLAAGDVDDALAEALGYAWEHSDRLLAMEHDLRHTAVALWIAAGANPKQIARWAGHTSVSVVLDRYGHLYQGHEGAVLTQLDRLLSTPGLTEGESAPSKASVIDTTATERCVPDP